ncbi:MAG: DUF3418 domain-containing protein [Bifidobacteriaceae bacterium]|nr:DUF3418 domain-containing protein [Bifidobacteriaceae bacterium]
MPSRSGAPPLTITYPPELPISAKRDEIARAIIANQVVIVSGETGSGKTTQIPKILLELGYGGRGAGRGRRPAMIAHTQPRRIAARSVAERIAQELGVPLGQTVGYQVRFTDHSGPATRLKLMTDGIVLAQIQADPLLKAYDAIIVDEAHERSLNIDFLLGYLKNLLGRRPELKLVITSATIDSELFARHFGPSPDRPAPVIHVSGRTYPVEIRYRPVGQDGVPEDQPTAIAAAARELLRTGDGDILVFCSGEREIADAADALATDLGALPGGRPGKHSPHDADRSPPATGQPHVGGAGAAGVAAAVGGAGVSGSMRGADVDGAVGGAGVSGSTRRAGVDGAVGVAGVSGSTRGADAAGAVGGAGAGIELLPLYSRLSAAEQHRVFERHAVRRIVLATNVAETSLTVPGIHYVIDPGTARISRYSKATKVQRLPIEPISQASANQRAGRCGRIAKGVCIRLYSANDFATRPEFTDPEILRTSLAAVILQMIAVGVAASPQDVARFPFVQPPDPRGVADGVKLLEELGAITHLGGRTQLTGIGRALARIPLDPRLGRMVIEAERLGVAREVTVIAAALTIQDPRERPVAFRAQADQAHARFNDPRSDFLSLLNLWEYLREQRSAGSSSAFRRLVRTEYLNYLRIREWQDLVKELRAALKEAARAGRRSGAAATPPPTSGGRASRPAGRDHGRQAGPNEVQTDRIPGGAAAPPPPGGRPGTPVDSAASPATQWRRHWPADAIHQALLTGLLSQVGMRPEPDTKGRTQRGRATSARAGAARPGSARDEYLGARGIKFAIFPGSGLRRKPPAWVMAAELVETSRLWARTCAAIDPSWVEQAAAHLAKPTYAEPRWSAKRGAALVTERVTVYGLPVVTGRPVPLSQIDPALARELFIRHALVEGDWRTDHAFYRINRELIDSGEELAARSRSPRYSILDEDLFEFYDRRIPEQVVSARHFDTWWNKTRRATPDLLTLTEPELVADATGARDGFPDQWVQGSLALPLTYEYAPGTESDGVTCHIPVQYANQVRPDGFDWQVPGLRLDLIAALIKALPKKYRAELLPARDTARQALERLGPPTDWLRPDGSIEPLTSALTRVFQDWRGVYVPDAAWAEATVPRHLRIEFAVEATGGQILAAGHDLRATVRAAAPDVSAAIGRVVAATAARPPRPAPAPDSPPPHWPDARTGLTTWDFGELPTEVVSGGGTDGIGHGNSGAPPVRGYPALVPTNGGADLKLLASAAEAAVLHPLGVRELLLGELALPARRLTSRLEYGPRAPGPGQAGASALLALAGSRYPSVAALVRDAQAAVVDAAVAAAGAPRDPAAYEALRAQLRGCLEDEADRVLRTGADLVVLGRRIEAAVERVAGVAVADSVADIKAHVAGLLGAGFLSRAGLARLADLRRYLKGDEYRLSRLGTARARENQGLRVIGDLREAYEVARAGALAAHGIEPAPLAEVAWMLEELRISLFAQVLGTAYPVSEKRIRRALAAP